MGQYADFLPIQTFYSQWRTEVEFIFSWWFQPSSPSLALLAGGIVRWSAKCILSTSLKHHSQTLHANLITSAKTRLPNTVTFQGSRVRTSMYECWRWDEKAIIQPVTEHVWKSKSGPERNVYTWFRIWHLKWLSHWKDLAFWNSEWLALGENAKHVTDSFILSLEF